MIESLDARLQALVATTAEKIVQATKNPSKETIGDAAKDVENMAEQLKKGIEQILWFLKKTPFGQSTIRFLEAASKSSQYAYVFAKFVTLAMPQAQPMEVKDFLDRLNGERVARQERTLRDAKRIMTAREARGLETPAAFLTMTREATGTFIAALESLRVERAIQKDDAWDFAVRAVIADSYIPYGNALARLLHGMREKEAAEHFNRVEIDSAFPLLHGKEIRCDYTDGESYLKTKAGITSEDTPETKKQKWDALRTTAWYRRFDEYICDIFLTDAYNDYRLSIGDTPQYGRDLELAFSPSFQSGYAGRGNYLPLEEAKARYDALWEKINSSEESVHYLNALAHINGDTLLAY